MPTWMIVEDELGIYEILMTFFEMWGVEGVAFVDGEEAIAYIDDVDKGKFVGQLPELALLDIRLPGEADGMDIANRLRDSPKLKNISIVMMTADALYAASQDDVLRKSRADLFLAKPLPKSNELQGILEDTVVKRRLKSEVAQTNGSVRPLEPQPAQPQSPQPASSTPEQAQEKLDQPITPPVADQRESRAERRRRRYSLRRRRRSDRSDS